MADLPPEQQATIVLAQIRARAQSQLLRAGLALGVAVLLAIVTVVAILRSSVPAPYSMSNDHAGADHPPPVRVEQPQADSKVTAPPAQPKIEIKRWRLGGLSILFSNPTPEMVTVSRGQLDAIDPAKNGADFIYFLSVVHDSDSGEASLAPHSSAEFYAGLFDCNGQGKRNLTKIADQALSDKRKWQCNICLKLLSSRGELETCSDKFPCSLISIPSSCTPLSREIEEGQILQKWPAPLLPGKMTVFVDDNSCPSDKMTMIIAGQVECDIPRRSGCVPRSCAVDKAYLKDSTKCEIP